ncbi:MAG: hypothetical protein QOF62_3690 [Pyrinomonadaceae bacterium]|jgi:uncharacterized protein (DUF488 family)|nr:hypothetical protein [Pyrinomonadaceae bacterium]
MKKKLGSVGSKEALRIWTVGHSTRSAEEFNEILAAHYIEALLDVRSFPGSRRYPQFNKQQLAASLPANNIAYFHLPELGGRRPARKDSTNTAWRNSSFRGYADHMESEQFQQGIEHLLEIAGESNAAIMCAEALWWRCHRSLISDYLKARGVEVTHILDATHDQLHPYTSAARIVDGELTYAGLFAG